MWVCAGSRSRSAFAVAVSGSGQWATVDVRLLPSRCPMAALFTAPRRARTHASSGKAQLPECTPIGRRQSWGGERERDDKHRRGGRISADRPSQEGAHAQPGSSLARAILFGEEEWFLPLLARPGSLVR
jgi:hypothetical protein